jgi:hypothetical protein
VNAPLPGTWDPKYVVTKEQGAVLSAVLELRRAVYTCQGTDAQNTALRFAGALWRGWRDDGFVGLRDPLIDLKRDASNVPACSHLVALTKALLDRYREAC